MAWMTLVGKDVQDRLDDVVRLAPAAIALELARIAGQHHARARLDEVHHEQSDRQRERAQDLKIDERLQPDPPTFFMSS